MGVADGKPVCTEDAAARPPAEAAAPLTGDALHEQLSGTDLPTVERAPQYALSGKGLPEVIEKPDAAYFVGKASIELEQSEAVDRHLEDVRQQLLEQVKRGEIRATDLVEAVVERQRLLAQLGRNMATGKFANAQLREVVRGLLTLAQAGDPQAIESQLRALGAAPVDRRHIKQWGSSLLGPSHD